MDIRPYSNSDRDACLTCCDPALHSEFGHFLNVPGTYFVMEHDYRIVGCGGFSLDSPTSASLRWGMIHADFRRMGLGRFLLMYRMKEIGRVGSVATVTVSPAPEFAAFSEREGFRAAGGVLMKKLAVCP